VSSVHYIRIARKFQVKLTFASNLQLNFFQADVSHQLFFVKNYFSRDVQPQILAMFWVEYRKKSNRKQLKLLGAQHNKGKLGHLIISVC